MLIHHAPHAPGTGADRAANPRAVRAIQRRHARSQTSRTAARMAHPIPARPRPHHPLARLPPARIQDPGFSQRHRRPSAHAADAHDGSSRHLAQHRQRAPAEHRPGRDHRARARPRPFAVRTQRRNRPERIDEAATADSSTTATASASSRNWSRNIRTSPASIFRGKCSKVWPSTKRPSTVPA